MPAKGMFDLFRLAFKMPLNVMAIEKFTQKV